MTERDLSKLRQFSCVVFILFLLWPILSLHSLSIASLLQNGDFEEGSLAPWSTYGPNDLAITVAKEEQQAWGMNNQYASLGHGNNSGSAILSQAFDIPDAVNQLTITFD